MINLNIAGIFVGMNKFFGSSAADEALNTLLGMAAQRVVFLDTPATSHLADLIRGLVAEGVEVVVRDHHDCPNPTSAREQAIADAAQVIREIDGIDAIISDRATNPACASLVQEGEFLAEGTVIIADPDADGLTATMRALGVTYDELLADAAILDGPRTQQTAEGGLSPLAVLLTKGMGTLPDYDRNRPHIAEGAKAQLFTEFALAASGDAEALAALESRVAVYEAAVAEAEGVEIRQEMPGVYSADITSGSPHLGTLASRMEREPSCQVTVLFKSRGPLASEGAPQVSLALPKGSKLNLTNLLEGEETGIPAGVLSNVPFLFHCTLVRWEEEFKGRLAQLLA